MKQIFIICEGFTEKAFVNEVLHTAISGTAMHGIFPGKPFNRALGGHINYARVKPDILAILKSRPDNFCTTFFDYYALGEFPRIQPITVANTPGEKAALIENAVEQDIVKELGRSFNPARFKACLSMHEFEALLFSDPARMASGLYQPDLQGAIRGIRSEFPTPEHINDGRETAPSKRIGKLIPGYDKIIAGNLAALAVGVDAMKAECEHFHSWFTWLASI